MHSLIAAGITQPALCCLISLHNLERPCPKNSYRTLTLTTTNNVVTFNTIESIARRDLKILYIKPEKDYRTGLTDKLYHGIILSLEQADIGL